MMSNHALSFNDHFFCTGWQIMPVFVFNIIYKLLPTSWTASGIQGVVKVFPELSNKNSAPSGGFEIHDPTVTLKKESVQEIVVETRKTH